VDQSKRPFLHMATQHMETPLNIPCYIGIQTRGRIDWKIEDFIQPIYLLLIVMSIILVHCDKVKDKKESNRKNKDRKIRRINMLWIFREKNLDFLQNLTGVGLWNSRNIRMCVQAFYGKRQRPLFWVKLMRNL
jgi:hypothetical protein